MKKTLLCCALIYASINLYGQSQLKYTAKVEAGYHFIFARLLKDMPEDAVSYLRPHGISDGIDLSFVNGISFRNNLRLGLGIAYLNYKQINGYTIFGDLEYVVGKNKVSPVVNLKIGKSYVNNIGDNTFVDFTGGVEHKVGKKLSLQYKTGLRFVHHSIFLPILIGAKF